MSGPEADRTRHQLGTLEVAQRLGLWEWIPATDQMIWSDGLYDLLDVAPSTPPTLNGMLARLHPADRLAFETHLSYARRERGLLTFRCRSDAERLLYVRMQRTLADDGSLRSIVGTNQDVTDEVLAGAPDLAIASMSTALVHELQAPLTRIAAALQVQSPTPSIHEALLAVASISRLLDDVELAARGDRSTSIPVRLDQIVARALSEIDGLDRRAVVVTRFGETSAVHASAPALTRVFVELIQNALDAMAPTPRRELQISTRSEGRDWSVVEIVDRGIGIPASAQSRVFEPFFTTKGEGRRGLGLSVSRGIVEGLGGSITIHSHGAGARVIVALPSSAPRSPGLTERRVASASPRTRVMIVDDEILFAKAISRLLATEHDVVTVHNGRRALDQIEAGDRFDVILCDLMMPLMTGAQLRAELVATAPDQADRMIFITGGALDPVSEALLGEVEYFEKPCDVAQLREAVRRRCRRDRV